MKSDYLNEINQVQASELSVKESVIQLEKELFASLSKIEQSDDVNELKDLLAKNLSAKELGE